MRTSEVAAVGDLPGNRQSLYLDARSAYAARESYAEWEASLERSPALSAAAKLVGCATMRAIACMVWEIDKKARER
jgi:hypothetical protein